MNTSLATLLGVGPDNTGFNRQALFDLLALSDIQPKQASVQLGTPSPTDSCPPVYAAKLLFDAYAQAMAPGHEADGLDAPHVQCDLADAFQHLTALFSLPWASFMAGKFTIVGWADSEQGVNAISGNPFSDDEPGFVGDRMLHDEAQSGSWQVRVAHGVNELVGWACMADEGYIGGPVFLLERAQAE